MNVVGYERGLLSTGLLSTRL